MKIKHLLIICLLPFLCQAQVVKSFKQLPDRVNITLSDGTLSIAPLADNAVRIKFYKVSEGNLPELVFTSGALTPAFQVILPVLKLPQTENIFISGRFETLLYRKTRFALYRIGS